MICFKLIGTGSHYEIEVCSYKPNTKRKLNLKFHTNPLKIEIVFIG